MSSVHESSWSLVEYLVEIINKLTHNLSSLLSTALELTLHSTDTVIDDEFQRKLSNFFHEFISLLAFDDFQLQLLKIFLFTFITIVALIFIAWHIYGFRISEQFMEPMLEVLTTMTEKIKSFFQRKKADVKFMNAGKGYKLTDSTNVSTSVPILTSKERVEPTKEAKTAGQAALARLQTKEPNRPKFNTSYAAIKAQVKRELEKERKTQEETRKNVSQSKEATYDTIKDNSLLAVSNIYYQCPYLSDEILSQEEWKIKIREFLYEQLQGEEPGLTACLIIQNCNTDKEKINSCIETLGKYLDNIIKNPEEIKYRKIRIHNRIFQEKVLPVEGAIDFLNAAGFWPKKLVNNDVEEDFLVWSPENCNIENIKILLDALKTAEPIPLELDRNLQVLLPTQASKRTELPLNFYNLTPEEIKKEQQLRTQTIDKNQMLRTKAMRERDEKRKLRKYKYSLIRIKFPDDLILQGTFMVHEKFRNVVNFVSENLMKMERPFCLKKLTGPTFNEEYFDKTLLELELYPAVLLIFFWQHTSDSESSGYLKEELLSLIQTV